MKRPGTKFIFLSGLGPEDRFKANTPEREAADFLVKPVNVEGRIDETQEVLGAWYVSASV